VSWQLALLQLRCAKSYRCINVWRIFYHSFCNEISPIVQVSIFIEYSVAQEIWQRIDPAAQGVYAHSAALR